MLAHQGGWDEILLVVGPIAVIAGLLWLAKKRVKNQTPTDQVVTGASGQPTRSISAPSADRRPTKSS
jgi:hypothetical protein